MADHALRYRRLAVEQLEDRRLLAAGGVTVITHGFQFLGTAAPDWTISMGQAILDRADGAATDRTTGSLFVHDPATNSWAAPPGSVWNNSYDADEDVVLVYNWADESDVFDDGWLEGAADALFASLLAENSSLPGSLAGKSFSEIALGAGGGGGLLDLHFIGHSRGAVLNSLVVERFDYYFPELTIDQVTTLDGHPASYMDDPGYVSSNPTANSRVFTYDNVAFADNYYEEDGSYEPFFTFDFDGVVANGAYNLRLPSAVLQNGGSTLEHSDVHSWYYGTITEPFAGAYSGYSGAGRNHDGDVSFPESWWGASGIPARAATGFAYSDVGGASRSGLPTTGAKIAAGAIASVFNGDFAISGATADLQGWELHGGAGNAASAGGELYLQLTASASFRRHNTLYFDRHAVAVEYDYQVNDDDPIGPDDVLRVLVGSVVVDEISLAAATGWVLNRQAAIDAALSGFVETLEFRIVDVGGGGIESAVRIDNVLLVTAAPVISADFDEDEDVDGADFLLWQRGVGAYLTAAKLDGDADDDGNVLGGDLAIWKDSFGEVESALAANLSFDSPMDAALADVAAAWQRRAWDEFAPRTLTGDGRLLDRGRRGEPSSLVSPLVHFVAEKDLPHSAPAERRATAIAEKASPLGERTSRQFGERVWEQVARRCFL